MISAAKKSRKKQQLSNTNTTEYNITIHKLKQILPKNEGLEIKFWFKRLLNFCPQTILPAVTEMKTSLYTCSSGS